MKTGAFSLAELLLASFLLLVGVVAAASLSFSVLSSQRTAGDLEVGQRIARQLLEEYVYDAQSNPQSDWWRQRSLKQIYAQQDSLVGGVVYRAVVYMTDVSLAADPEVTSSGVVPLTRLEVIVYRPDADAHSGHLQARLSRMLYAP